MCVYIYILKMNNLNARNILVFINILVQIKVVGYTNFIVYIKVNEIVGRNNTRNISKK